MTELTKVTKRMVFLAALTITETEAAMKFEETLPGGINRKRWRILDKMHAQSFDIFSAYDSSLNQYEIYDLASKCIDAINKVLDEEDETEIK